MLHRMWGYLFQLLPVPVVFPRRWGLMEVYQPSYLSTLNALMFSIGGQLLGAPGIDPLYNVVNMYHLPLNGS
jgi:hypothetical protein